MTMRFAPAVALGLLLAASAGCGRSGSPGEPIAEENMGLYEVGQLILLHDQEHGRPPARLADVERYEPGFPIGFLGLMQRELVVFWGAGLAEGPEASGTVLAYEEQVPERGGFVLTRDNAVRRMTAEQFAAAPKAGAEPSAG